MELCYIPPECINVYMIPAFTGMTPWEAEERMRGIQWTQLVS